MATAIGYFDSYDCGHGDVMFRTFRPDGSFGSCHCIPSCEAEKNANALERIGYLPRPADMPTPWSRNSAS